MTHTKSSLIPRRELRQLAAFDGRPQVSLFLPLQPEPQRARQDPIRLKNLLREATSSLTRAGVDGRTAEQVLGGGRELLDDREFWHEHSARGLALFLAPGFQARYRVARELPELAVTGERFAIRPLIPFLDRGEAFRVLALSENSARLFEGTRDGLEEVPLPGDPPSSLAEARERAGTETEKTLQHHTAPAGKRPGTRHGVRHGHGRPADEEEAQLLDYFRPLAAGLEPLLNRESRPLVLAAVERHHPRFREVCQSRFVLEEGVIGNPDRMSAEELHERALPVVEPWFEERFEKKRSSFQDLLSSGRASAVFEDVFRACLEGRVDWACVADDAELHGHYDREKRQLTVDREKSPEAVDLLNELVAETLLHDGDVDSVPKERVPGDAEDRVVAAVYRW